MARVCKKKVYKHDFNFWQFRLAFWLSSSWTTKLKTMIFLIFNFIILLFPAGTAACWVCTKFVCCANKHDEFFKAIDTLAEWRAILSAVNWAFFPFFHWTINTPVSENQKPDRYKNNFCIIENRNALFQFPIFSSSLPSFTPAQSPIKY